MDSIFDCTAQLYWDGGKRMDQENKLIDQVTKINEVIQWTKKKRVFARIIRGVWYLRSRKNHTKRQEGLQKRPLTGGPQVFLRPPSLVLRIIERIRNRLVSLRPAQHWVGLDRWRWGCHWGCGWGWVSGIPVHRKMLYPKQSRMQLSYLWPMLFKRGRSRKNLLA